MTDWDKFGPCCPSELKVGLPLKSQQKVPKTKFLQSRLSLYAAFTLKVRLKGDGDVAWAPWTDLATECERIWKNGIQVALSYTPTTPDCSGIWWWKSMCFYRGTREVLYCGGWWLFWNLGKLGIPPNGLNREQLYYKTEKNRTTGMQFAVFLCAISSGELVGEHLAYPQAWHVPGFLTATSMT